MANPANSPPISSGMADCPPGGFGAGTDPRRRRIKPSKLRQTPHRMPATIDGAPTGPQDGNKPIHTAVSAQAAEAVPVTTAPMARAEV